MKSLRHVTGNLLTHPEVQVVGHQANCQNTFGSGIARTIKEMYPEAYRADTYAAVNKRNTLGNLSFGEVRLVNGITNSHGNHIRRIYNLYGQNLGTDHTKLNQRKTNYEALYCALEKMALDLQKDGNNYVVGFPHLIGCGLGGGNWNIVERLIQVAFADYQSEVIIVELKK